MCSFTYFSCHFFCRVGKFGICIGNSGLQTYVLTDICVYSSVADPNLPVF
jgi:hypothetical protein